MTISQKSKSRCLRLGTALAALTLSVSALADQVIVLCKPSGFNSCPTWCENAPLADWSGSGSSSHSTAVGDNATGSTFAFQNLGPAQPSISITPTLGFDSPTTCYQVDVTHISGNASPNILVALTVSGANLVTTLGGTTPATQTDGFQATKGINAWYTIGYLTNLTTTTPTVTFTYISGTLAATGGRWYTDGYRFTETGLACQNSPQLIAVNGPLAAGQTNVNVPNLTNAPTKVNVYSDDGTGVQTSIGSLTVSGQTNAVVPTTPLVKGTLISATQIVGGQESCLVPTNTGALVGGGANTFVGFCLDMQQDATLTGPIGATGGSASSDLYFLGADGRTGGFGTAPRDPVIITPSTCWQTVSIDPTTASYFHWNTSTSTLADPNQFAQLDALAIAIEDTDAGPYDIYIDNFVNGDTVIENWEEATNGQAAVGFSQPSFSTTTSGDLLSQPPGSITPNISVVTTNHADSV